MQDRVFGIVEKAISTEMCDMIRQYGDILTTRTAGVVGDSNPSPNIRNSKTAWFSPHEAKKHHLDFREIYKTVDDVVHGTMDQMNLNYDIHGRQAFQYTHYHEDGLYDWHRDQFKEPHPDDHEFPAMIRKVSVVILLSDPDEYTGGNLEGENPFRFGPHQLWHRVHTITKGQYKAKGTAIVFPSWAYHRVTPVTTGHRRSLVGWYLGPPYR